MKHVFSANEKRLFVLVLSLQVVTNVAYVLKENTEEGAERHEMWQQLFILVDLVCCGAVLFPIVWSIRHLQEATQVDGKVSGVQKILSWFSASNQPHFWENRKSTKSKNFYSIFIIQSVSFAYKWVARFYCHYSL